MRNVYKKKKNRTVSPAMVRYIQYLGTGVCFKVIIDPIASFLWLVYIYFYHKEEMVYS